MMRWLLRIFLIGVSIAIVGAIGGGYWAWQELQRPYRGHEGEVTIEIAPGTAGMPILEKLEGSGVLVNAWLARAFLVFKLDDQPLQAGEYRFEEALSTPQVLERLIRGRVITYPARILEGLTLEETAESLASQGFGDLETLRLEMQRSDRIADLDPEATDLEGYLYPDTYHFARGATEAEIVATLVRTFRQRFENEVQGLLSGTHRAGRPLTVRDLVTLASIVEKEVGVESERAEIAGVYSNRLRIGMGLYADPTTIYALKRLGRWDGNLRRPDLALDSPYNTYVYKGLPPGPICSPGVASMIAAARPAESKFLYFVSRNDGTHVFAETHSEHQRNVNVWQKQYWRKRWAEERQQRNQ